MSVGPAMSSKCAINTQNVLLKLDCALGLNLILVAVEGVPNQISVKIGLALECPKLIRLFRVC